MNTNISFAELCRKHSVSQSCSMSGNRGSWAVARLYCLAHETIVAIEKIVRLKRLTIDKIKIANDLLKNAGMEKKMSVVHIMRSNDTSIRKSRTMQAVPEKCIITARAYVGHDRS